MRVEHIYEICQQLKGISSTKEKQRFLLANKDDLEFTSFLKWLLDPAIITGIDKKKLKKKIETPFNNECVNLDFALDYLTEHNTGRDIDVAVCQMFMKALPDYFDFLVSVFSKTLKLGVDVKTVNKVYGKGFIHIHEVMLGSPRDKLRLKDGENFTLTQKLNGIRCTYVNGKMISRQGKEFVGLEHIAKELDNIHPMLVFDGELIRKNVDGISDNENFRLTTSMVNSEDGNKHGLEFVLFDCLPYDEFVEGKSNAMYTDRREYLDRNIKDCKYLRVVPLYYQGNDVNMIDKYLAEVDSLGYEGLMLNKNNAPYECKRVTSLIKIKTFKFSDLKVIDVLEGDGKYVSQLGSIVVDYKGNPVNVGSGFTDEQRIKYWAIKDELIGSIAEVKYKEVSKNKDTCLESLQFPIFIQWRNDKTEVSYE